MIVTNERTLVQTSGDVSNAPLDKKTGILVLVLIYKAKIIVLGCILKVLFMFWFDVTTTTWLKSYAATFSSCFWCVDVVAPLIS